MLKSRARIAAEFPASTRGREGTTSSRAAIIQGTLPARLKAVPSRPRQHRAAKRISGSRQILHGLKAVQDDAL
jgi:hypothetical protein